MSPLARSHLRRFHPMQGGVFPCRQAVLAGVPNTSTIMPTCRFAGRPLIGAYLRSPLMPPGKQFWRSRA